MVEQLLDPAEHPKYLVEKFGSSIIKTRAEALRRTHSRLVDRLKLNRRERRLQTDLNPTEVETYLRTIQENYPDKVTLRKRLIDRGTWKVKHTSNLNLNGVLLIQFSEPRERFLADAPNQSYRTADPSALISTGLYRYLTRRLFDEQRVSSYDELEKRLKKKASSSRDIFTGSSADHHFFGSDDDYEVVSRSDWAEDQVGALFSTPVFRDHMFPYDAVVISDGITQIVELGSESAMLNISVKPGEEADPGTRYEGDPADIDRSHAVVSIRARLGIRDDSPIGTAYLVD